jgi:hypothetical protein
VTETPEGGTPLAGDHPVYLQDPIVDAAVRMLVELSAQLWVERERRLVTEQLLEARGLLRREDIEQYKPDAEALANIRRERSRYLESVFKELRRIPVGQPGSPQATE